MPGPPSKSAEERRRRNRTAGRRTLPAASPISRRPTLGRRKPAWLKSTRDYWATIWASPMATTWIEADVPTLKRLTLLVELVNRGEVTAMILAEIRQLEDRFGLSPLARRKLEWELPARRLLGRGEEAVSGATKDDVGDDSSDDERWLRAVPG